MAQRYFAVTTPGLEDALLEAGDPVLLPAIWAGVAA